MTIDDSVFAPVAARTNLYRDETRNAWRIRIPERANIALDTVVTHAHGPRRDHPALVFRGRGRFGAPLLVRGSGRTLRPPREGPAGPRDEARRPGGGAHRAEAGDRSRPLGDPQAGRGGDDALPSSTGRTPWSIAWRIPERGS